MSKNLKWRPILASVLVFACARGAFSADVEQGVGYSSVYDYASHVDFTVNYDSKTNTVENFPLYFKLKDGSPTGFHYEDIKNADADGQPKDLRFFDSKGRSLPYEITKWNPQGESTFWILLPSLAKGATMTMCWNLRDGCSLPDNAATNVWKEYVGVWHMDETITAATAATTYSADATGHGLDAEPSCGVHDDKAQGDLAQMISAAGPFGNARINATASKQWGNHLKVPSYDEFKVGGEFTVSCWVKLSTLEKYAQLLCRKSLTKTGDGWHVESKYNQRQTLTLRGANDKNADVNTFGSSPIGTSKFYHLAICYSGASVSVYCNGLFKGSGAIDPAADNGEPLLIGCGHLGEWMTGGDFTCINGSFDEVRLCKGTRNAGWIAADYAVGTNSAAFYLSGTVTNDASAVLKNEWMAVPYVTKMTWDAGGPLPTLADFNLGDPVRNKGRQTIQFYNRSTGELLGGDVPKAVGDYRAVITLDEGEDAGATWGALEYTLEFRIVSGGGKHEFGINVDRIMLFNDDYSGEGGEVECQSYADELESDELPYWQHLDADGNPDSSTPSAPEYEDDWSVLYAFNLGGGTRHAYWRSSDDDEWMWFLDGVRIGNTFNNGAYVTERGDEGLKSDQNYLPWNYDSQRVIFGEDVVDGYHRYAGQAVMQNALGAAITSPCYTNGIGTIYFDAVNGWTENAYDEDGNPSYQLAVQIATKTVPERGMVYEPFVQYTSSHPSLGVKATDPFLKADWETVPLHVLRFDDGVCTDLGVQSKLTMDVEDGGSAKHFYRVYVPVTNTSATVRFRIVRTAIDKYYELNPDGDAFILIDNIICSTPAARVKFEPYGEYFSGKAGKAVLGCEGAFSPAFPAVTDSAVYGRAKVTLDGSPVPAGSVSSATMHYRWHYLGQKTTGWKVADLNLSTFETLQPLQLPPFQGDIEFWFDANQQGNYYEYSDYSGTGLGMAGKYTEEIPSVTNEAPTVVRSADGTRKGDWFVRMREGKSSVAEMKLVIRGVAETVDLYPSEDHLWRGMLPVTNVVSGGIYWRIEQRNKQEDGAKAWNWSTNCLYVTEWDQSLSRMPTFPAAARLSEGTTNDWSRMPYDKQTGYLMFQVDESSLGVTVVRADYQNFNDWNDAHGDYFVGSFASTNDMHGTSANVRTYDEKYTGWRDTLATNELWELRFNGKNQKIGEGIFTGYKTFGADVYTNYFNAWKLGKGQWVYGKYREPESHVALQMAGNGEGYAEFSNTADVTWPRGVESVSFKARIAQSVSPEFVSCYDEGKRMSNYTFMARTCFDMNKNMNFSGNAALSLFAYYRANKGAYEARWEQVGGVTTDSPYYDTEVLKPEPRGQRLVISRWDFVDNRYKETELFAVTNSVSFDSGATAKGLDMPTMPWDGPKTNNLMPFCISVFNEKGTNIIVAAVRISTASQTTSAHGGVTWSESISKMGDNWYFAFACDGDNPLPCGTYGVLSSNCEGMFLTPQLRRDATYPSDLSPSKLLEVKDKKGYYSKKSLNSMLNYESCCYDLPWWEVDPCRMEVFWGDGLTGSPYGLTYVPQSQTVDIYAAPLGSSTWGTLFGSIKLTGFGSPTSEANCFTNFYYANDCKVRLQTGGNLAEHDYPIDVAISDIVIRQWRGEDNWSSREDESTSKQSEYGRTNIVFTTGWVTNGAVRLSAKRSEAGTACSVRSPLFDGLNGRGIGLGMVSITYRKPETALPADTVLLKVQIVTNFTWQSGLQRMSQSVTEGDGNRTSWCTVSNLTYRTLMQDELRDKDTGLYTWRSGTSLSLHGVQGMMRVVIDDNLVTALKNETDTDRFGEIDIVEAAFKDEPALDKGCWWGWNMLTVGSPNDAQSRMYLPDCTSDLSLLGQSLALNNSLTADVDPKEVKDDQVKKHMPFVQSPTFTNAVIGQISFKARKYDLSDRAPDAKIVVYGADQKDVESLVQDSDWKFIAEFPITNTLYTTYTCKTDAKSYYALRLGVVDVKGTEYPPDEPSAGKTAQRVLIDEVTISEAVRAMLAFRSVGAFRTNLNDTAYVAGVPSRAQQPLCDENWGVQAEVYATMLGSEIDTSEGHEPMVKLHWYVSEPDSLSKASWGYENWKRKETGSGYLERAKGTGSNYVFRSSYQTKQNTVIHSQSVPGTVVQYMLEVQYWTINSTKEGAEPVRATNWLDSTSWTVPEWFAPVDYNSDPKYGANKTFAGFTILDTIAPGWAWINEANVFGTYDSRYQNSDNEFQYVEVCVPLEADLTGWSVRLLEAGLYNNKVTTNNVAYFGTAEFTAKKNSAWGASNMVFRCIGNKESDKMKKADGTLDGVWTFDDDALGGIFARSGSLDYINDIEVPFGIQLVRPSGVIEHSVVVVGTNGWEGIISDYDPTNIVRLLNQNVPGSKFFYPGADHCGTFRSDSVTTSHGEDATCWANDWACSPGRINTNFTGQVQRIDPDHPTPSGESILIYASVDTEFGHIVQHVGSPDSDATNTTELIILPRGSKTGTNIYYKVDRWYEMKTVVTNGKYVAWQPGTGKTPNPLEFNVGRGASNNITVVASAQVLRSLSKQYGLTEDNPYTPAVMDWLIDGNTLNGPFAYPDSDDIALADYVRMDGTVVTNLSLTQMYWLDMDPTVSNLIFQAGMLKSEPVIHPVAWHDDGTAYDGDSALTNVRMRVFMMISNKVENVYGKRAWSPYVLRGLEPGSVSRDYTEQSEAAWTSETFKVTGILANGFTRESDPDCWVALRWFVFHDDSFFQPGEDEPEHPRYTTDIEIVDPHSTSSPGYDAGWYDWCRKNRWVPVFNSWSIDTSLRPVGVEVLNKTNFYPSASH